MSKEKLKPCPCCGGHHVYDVYLKRDWYKHGGFTYQIKCNDCGLTVEGNTKANVEEKWDKRTYESEGN